MRDRRVSRNVDAVIGTTQRTIIAARSPQTITPIFFR